MAEPADCAMCALLEHTIDRQTEALNRLHEETKLRRLVFADLEHALSALVAQVKRVGGYMTPEEQAVLWQAEQLVAKHGGGR